MTCALIGRSRKLAAYTCTRVGTVTGLDYWTGLPDWTTILDYWTGLPDWTTRLDYWTGLPDWTTGLTQTAKYPLFRAKQKLNVLLTSVTSLTQLPTAFIPEFPEVKGHIHI